MQRFLSFATLTNVALIGMGLFGCQTDSSVEPTSIAVDCLVKASSSNGTAIAGDYIITYQPAQALPSASGARMAATEALAEQLLTANHVANAQATVLATGAQTSFLAHLTESESQKLQQDPSIILIEPDRIMSIVPASM